MALNWNSACSELLLLNVALNWKLSTCSVTKLVLLNMGLNWKLSTCSVTKLVLLNRALNWNNVHKISLGLPHDLN